MKKIRYIAGLVTLLLMQTHIHASGQWDKSFNKLYIQCLENTPFGILAGEFDTRMSLNPFNGIYISRDFGSSFTELALKGRGISDLYYTNDLIIAGTYYSINGVSGIFISRDGGINWEHVGNNYSVSAVGMVNHTILVGTYSNGLWVSPDEGITWKQKLGDGWFGPKIEGIYSGDSFILVSTTTQTYISEDLGETWIPVEALKNKYLKYFAGSGNLVIAGSYNLDGLYISKDSGKTWEKLSSFGSVEVSGLIYYDHSVFAGKKPSGSNRYSVFQSADLGKTWTDTLLLPLGINKISEIIWVYSKPWFLFSSVLGDGVYRYTQNTGLSTPGTFKRPWKSDKTNPIVDYISAFFDHSYPLLAYGAYKEPDTENSTTVNFFGIRGSEPDMYYSTHDGIDFALPLGTEITAVSGGTANYIWCTDCGNSIYINHPEGYQTRYMHLQKDGLVVTSGSEPVSVVKGQIIGKVGLTGRTTGPHLHFTVVKDANGNNHYDDDTPDGKSDPFGWLNSEYPDPWPELSWEDYRGTHIGSASRYLWDEKLNLVSSTAPAKSNTSVTAGNTTLNITPSATDGPITIEVFDYSIPSVSLVDRALAYFPDTSTIINAFNQMGEAIKQFTDPITITFQLGMTELTGFDPKTLKVYFWDAANNLWAPIASLLDQGTGVISAKINHLSRFVVMGTKTDNNPPLTTPIIEGDQYNGWYTEYPVIGLHAADESNIAYTLYSLDSGDTWINYTVPFYLDTDGVIGVCYKSADTNGNVEDTNETVVKIDTQGTWKHRILIKNTTFTFD